MCLARRQSPKAFSRIAMSMKPSMKRACLVLAVILAVGACAGPILAATMGVALGVVPLSIHLELSPGQSASGQIDVMNTNQVPINLKVYLMDRVTKSNGQILFTEPGTGKFSAATWLTVDTGALSMTPGETKKVDWKITVPEDAEPGEHATVIFFEPDQEQAQAGQVNIGTRIGTVITVKVPGQIRREGKLVGFHAEQPPIHLVFRPFGRQLLNVSFKLPFRIFDGGPIPLGAGFENTGNISAEVTSKVEILTKSGKSVANLTSADSAVIFPGDSWTVSATWDDPPTFGRFVAKLHLNYGPDVPELTAETTFNVFPVRQALALLVFAAGIWFIRGGITALVQRRRRKREKRKAKGASPGGVTSTPSSPEASPVPAPTPAPTSTPASTPAQPPAAPPSPMPATIPPRSSKTDALAPTAPPAGPSNGQPSNGSNSSTVIGSRRDRKKN